MARARRAEQLLAAVSRLCLALPEATREIAGEHAIFRVRKRVFAYYLDNHRGDGIVAVACKTAVGENEELARLEPERYYLPAYIAPRGWVGLRLDRGAIDWQEVADLAAASYRLVAPKKLAAAVGDR
jgi:phosphoribosylglycinamide formyltransferase-1